MKPILVTLFFVFSLSFLFAQEKVTLSGTVYDKETNEAAIAAQVSCAGKVALTEVDGTFSFQVDPNKTYTIEIVLDGYNTESFSVPVGTEPVNMDFKITSAGTVIDEVIIKAELGKARETPIAFSNIDAKKIAEELGTRDLPMILNSTPGAYATEQGGGAGDARVSIRGFDQRNVAVLVDGVPVNDMENGQVYWSNWDGLGDITRYMQVQRGLGASKLSIVSVGGTMNIVTRGIDQKMSASVKQEVNSYGLYKTSFGYNTGLLKGNWGVTVAGSRKWGSSYADATFDDAWSYFVKVQKRFDKHLFSFGVNGAPQSHGQRTTRLPIAVIDQKLAEKAGIDYRQALDSMSYISSNDWTTPTQGARGIRYNPNYGMLNGKEFNEKVNFFHKPQFNLTHSWTPNKKFNLSNVLYASVGRGGGTSTKTTPARDTVTGLYDYQGVYDYNSVTFANAYSTTEHASSNYLRSANNDHQWFGILSTANYKINDNWTSMFGIDARYYKGSHYQTVYDLMGGDYAIDNSDKNQPKGAGNTQYGMKREGDKISYYNDAFVKWGGLFGQVEYKKNKWSTFMTASVSETSYKRVDYFKKKDLVFADTTMVQAVGFGDTVTYNGQQYTNNSAEARFATTEEKWFLGATIKAGANYNINDHHNVFVNMGYLNIAPKMNTVFDNNNMPFLEVENQKVTSVELGYGYRSKKIAANVNAYYTLWENKPQSNTPTVVTPDGTFSYNVNGLDALHMGIELDVNYRVHKKLNLEALASIGDWKTISGSIVQIVDNDGNIVETLDFSAKNVHVGDAAQIQLGGSVRYDIVKNLYVKARYTFFGKNYANFDPIALTGANKDRESWKMPNYALLDFNIGYDMSFAKYKVTISGGLMNALDAIYITDAQNGQDFDAATATVFVGMGRRFNIGVKIGF
jgi:hypothetical protein